MVHYPVPTKDLRVAALNRQLLRDQTSSSMGKRKRVRRRRKHVVRSICSFNERLLLFTFLIISLLFSQQHVVKAPTRRRTGSKRKRKKRRRRRKKWEQKWQSINSIAMRRGSFTNIWDVVLLFDYWPFVHQFKIQFSFNKKIKK